MKKTLAYMSAGFLLLTLASCASGEGLDSETESAAVSSQGGAEESSSSGETTSSTDDAERLAFGGQCDLFGQNVFRSMWAMHGIGAINFDPNRTDEGMENLSAKGFGSYAEWIAEVETVRGAFSGVDMSLLSEEESGTIRLLESSFESSTSMTEAFERGDIDWYTSTYDAMMSILEACE